MDGSVSVDDGDALAASFNKLTLDVFRTLPVEIQSKMREAAQEAREAAQKFEAESQRLRHDVEHLQAEVHTLRAQGALRSPTAHAAASAATAAVAAATFRNPPLPLRGRIADILRMEARHKKELMSPSLMPTTFLKDPAVSVRGAPVWLAPPSSDISSSFQRILDTAEGDAFRLTSEELYRGLASRHLPARVQVVGAARGEMEARAIFDMTAFDTGVFELTDKCKPELHVRADTSAGMAPAFQGELKSVGKTVFDQGVYYTLMDMVRCFGSGAGEGSLRFFRQPLIGYTLVAFPHVAYLLSVEMVGKLFIAPASAPFFVGSDAHRQAVDALQDIQYEDAVLLTEGDWRDKDDDDDNSTMCRLHEGEFQKKLSFRARTADGFARMCHVYRVLEGLPYDTCPNSVVQQATMLFGWHSVLIRMPGYPNTTECTDGDIFGGGHVTERVADGVAWLAVHKILYTGVTVRGPNVLKLGDDVHLVDFDDCEVVDAPITSVEQYRALLQGSHAAQQALASVMPMRTFALRCHEPMFATFMESLQGAFERILKHQTPEVAGTATECLSSAASSPSRFAVGSA